MYRQSPSRNQRSKGIRVKHVLQICLLLAVCFWLIYQVKHSHEKKKEFDESDAKALIQGANSDEIIKLGRKDIRPQVEGTISKNGKHDEPIEEEETIGEVVEENRHEEDEPEDKKVEMKEDKEMGAEDDETDEHEQDKPDAEVEKEEDLVDDEEREAGDENETQETDSEDGQGQMEKESSNEDTDHDGDDRSTHEAREEHYKADDASSAVTHGTQIVTSGNENELVENSNEHPENMVDVENQENKGEENNEGEIRKDLEVEGGETARDYHQSNVTTTETNNTVTEESNNPLMSDVSPEVAVETHDLSPQNVTESEPKLEHDQEILSEGTSAEGLDLQTIANNSSAIVHSNLLDSNSTGSTETKDTESHSEFSSNNTDSSASEKITISEASVEGGNITESSSEKNDEIQDEKPDKSDGADETLESTATEDPEEVQHDAIDMSDTSNSAEETDNRVDLDTLPQIQTEGMDNEDAAAE